MEEMMFTEVKKESFDIELANQLWNEIKGMKNDTYIPTTKAELIAMDNFELKCRMQLNETFYNTAIELLNIEVDSILIFQLLRMVLHAVDCLDLSIRQRIDQFQAGEGFAIRIKDNGLVLLSLCRQAHLSFFFHGFHLFEMLEQSLIQIQNTTRIACFQWKKLD